VTEVSLEARAYQGLKKTRNALLYLTCRGENGLGFSKTPRVDVRALLHRTKC